MSEKVKKILALIEAHLDAASYELNRAEFIDLCENLSESAATRAQARDKNKE